LDIWKNIFEISRKGGMRMGKAPQFSCSVCGSACDPDNTFNCTECGEYICEECSSLYEGYCEECYDNISQEYDEE